MKKVIFSSFVTIASLFAFHSLVFSQENAGVNAVSVAVSERQPSSNPLSLVVTGDGRLVVKPGPVFTEGGHYEGMILPYLISNPKPIVYPRWAVRQGWQGKLSIALEILANGSVGRTKVMQSTGHRMLDQAGEQAVHGWKFSPAVKNGRPVVTCIQIPIIFQLED